MAFRYDYKSNEELDLTYKQLTPGECKFLVKSIQDKDERGFELTNSKGNQFLRIDLVVVDGNNQKGLVRENISSNAAWKIKELCEAVGMPQLYNSNGEMEPKALVGLSGKAVIEERSYTKNDGSISTVSSIKRYLPGERLSPEKAQEAGNKEVVDDDLPF